MFDTFLAQLWHLVTWTRDPLVRLLTPGPPEAAFAGFAILLGLLGLCVVMQAGSDLRLRRRVSANTGVALATAALCVGGFTALIRHEEMGPARSSAGQLRNMWQYGGRPTIRNSDDYTLAMERRLVPPTREIRAFGRVVKPANADTAFLFVRLRPEQAAPVEQVLRAQGVLPADMLGLVPEPTPADRGAHGG